MNEVPVIPPCSKSVRLTTAEYLALLRDGLRYRKLERAHAHHRDCGWGRFPEFSDPYCLPETLAEIADALPEEPKP